MIKTSTIAIFVILFALIILIIGKPPILDIVGNVSINTTINNIQNVLFRNNSLSYPQNIDKNKICPYRELCIGGFEKMNNNIFCKSACQRKKENNCNYNRICEGFENGNCPDCQCFDGIVCGGICYRNKINFTCENDFLLEKKPKPENSLSFRINFPKFLERDKWIEGNVTIINDNNVDVKSDIYWDLDGIETDLNLEQIKSVSLKAGEKKTINFSIKGVDVSDSIVGKTILDLMLEVTTLLVSSNSNSLKKEFVVYDERAAKCGDGYFNYKGMCVGGLFFLDANCFNGEKCVDKMEWWFDKSKEIDAKGNIKVGFAIINILNPSKLKEEFNQIAKNTSKWYKLEGIKYTGKDIINITFEYIGNYTFNISDFREDLKIGGEFENSETYRELAKVASLEDYNIIIVIVPNLPFVGGEAGGINYDGKHIALNIDYFTDITVIHELAHSFGCKDLDKKWYLCKNRWAGSLMCEETGKTGIEKLELGNCAAEMGWGDLNNNGIIDVKEY